MQRRVFQAIGLPDDEIESRFGFVLDAFSYGAPPHAGFAVGLDRLVMILSGEESIREVIAFPKTTRAADLYCGAPAPVDPAQLADVHVRTELPARAAASEQGPAETSA